MASEALPETSRRRRFKLSTPSLSKPPTDQNEDLPTPTGSETQFTAHHRFRQPSTIAEVSTSRDNVLGSLGHTARPRLRDVAILRSKMSVETKINRGLPLTLDEQNSFFAGNWDGLPRQAIWPDEKTSPTEAEAADEGVQSEGTPLIVSELKLRKDCLQRNGGVAITARKEQVAEEEKVISFVPSGEAAQSATQGPDNIRLLEEEGFYVGDRPIMAQRNVERMRERLQKQTADDKVAEWFDESGGPLALPDPLRLRALRILPTHGEKISVYRKAVVEGTKPVGEDNEELFRLEIGIGRLHFSHHYLFSGEHVLASKLNELYTAYVDWQSRDLIKYWRQQLNAVQLALNVVRQELAKATGQTDKKDAGKVGDLELRQEMYFGQVNLIRKQLNTELAAEMSLTRGIIGAWRALKEHRNSVGYVITGFKLVITRKMPTAEETQKETDEWRLDVEEETDEMYEVAVQEYQKAVAKNQPSGELAEDETSGSAVPLQPDRSTIHAKIVQHASEQRRQPGSPKLFFDLQPNGITVTALEQLPKPEQNRRHDVMRTNVWLRLVLGTSTLSETSRRPLGSDFSVEFDHTFPVLLSELPDQIAVEIHESSMAKLATVYIPVPDAACLSNRPFTSLYEFTSPNEHAPSSSSTAVGSGLPYHQGLVSGSLKAGSAWSPEAVPPAAVTRAMSAMNARSSKHVMDAGRIREMISSGALDPNHPNNAELVYLLRSSPSVGTAVSPVAYFRLQHLQDEFSFVTDEEFASSARFKMLEYRNREIDEFRKLKMIPAEERDVDSALVRHYETQDQTHQVGEKEADEVAAEFAIASQTGVGFHEFEMKRREGARHLDKARMDVVRQLNIAAHKLSLADVVFEDDVPSIRTSLEAMVRIFEPKRPLMPKRITRKKIPGQNLQPGDVSLIISVLRAHVRLPQQGSPLGPPEMLRIYAEVTFQDKTQETSVGMGTEPTWNEKMKFAFRAPNDDFSPSSLQTANDYIYISVFARRSKVLGTDLRGDASVITQRFERLWLGTLKLRWSAVYLNTTIEGTFYVPQVEPSLLGTNQLLVSVYATLSPALLLPDGPPSELPTSEAETLVQRAEMFKMKYSSKFPSREILLTVIDITGKKVFVSRFLKKLRPPAELIGDETAPDTTDRRIARFVSLIPFVSDMSVFPVQIDVWATVEQFLQMLSGDDEEHSCLLACYFLYLNRQAFLAVGSAVPEGRSTFTISETHEGRYVAWDPKTGLPYDLSDPFCPLQTVDCVITHDNVYANIQRSNRTADLNMTLTDHKLWEAFFKEGEFTHEIIPQADASEENQQIVLNNREAALRLRIMLRDRIHRELNKWRETGRNALNRLLSHRVQEHLQRLESHRRDGTLVEFDDLGEELERYGVTGFTLQQPFTTVQAIIDAVRATRVWQISDEEVTYVLAVHVEPYPMTVLAVWVYIGIQSGTTAGPVTHRR